MKLLIVNILIIAVGLTGLLNAQVQLSDSARAEMIRNAGPPMDTIIKLNKDTLLVFIMYKDFEEVIYIHPATNVLSKEKYPTLREIRFADGVINTMSNRKQEKKDSIRQSKVIVPVQAADTPVVKPLTIQDIVVCSKREELPAEAILKGDIICDFTGDYKSTNEYLERICTSLLKRKALNKKARYVLVVSKEIVRNYGEDPIIQMKAEIYD